MPRIALLSNGHEPYKGSAVVKETYKRLESSTLNFVGNIESRDIFDDRADVIVCDGFVGNILLKSIQGTARALTHWLGQEYRLSWWRKILLILSAKLLKELKQKIDYAKKGGALLLGVNHPLIIAHGCSHAVAIENAILFAHRMVKEEFIPAFNAEVALLMQQRLAPQGIVARTLGTIFKGRSTQPS